MGIILLDKIDVKREALYCFRNALHTGSNQAILKMIDLGLLYEYVKILELREPSLILICLDSITLILEFGNTYYECQTNKNPYFKILEEFGAFKIFENLQYINNEAVVQASQSFINKFFDTE